MPVEQVNAWGSYDKTAKEARTLDRGSSEVTSYPTELRQRRRSSRGSNELGDSSRHNRRRHSLYDSHRNLLNLSRHRVEMPLRLSSSCHPAVSLARLSSSRHGTRLSDLPSPQESPAGPGFFETLVTEKKYVGIPENLPPNERHECAFDDLDDETLDAIRDTFPIFFEDSMMEKKKKPFGIKSIFAAANATMPWQYDSLKYDFLKFIGICLRGIGQVYFQNNPLTGLLILIGMFVQSSRIAVHGIIALVCGTSVALLLGFDSGLARSGLFGYNSFLVGLAIATFHSSQEHTGYDASILISTVVFSSLSSVIFVMLGKLLVPYKSPPLTLPFNVATMIFIAASANMNRVDFNPVRTPALPDYESPPFDGITVQAFFAGAIRGVGQVFLADNIVSGVLVLLGIAICSRISAIAAFLGSALGAATALAVGVPGSAVEMGMFGFNASLTVTAMFMFYTPSMGGGVLAVMAGVATVLTQQASATMLEPFGLPFMTLPFCLVGLPFIIIQGTTSIVIAVPLSSMTTPEDHFRTVKMLEDGFAFLKECLDSDSSGGRGMTRARSRKMIKSLSRLDSVLSGFDQDDMENVTAKKGFCFQTKKDPQAIAASALFKKLDQKGFGAIHIKDTMKALQEAGLVDSEGLHFARLVLDLMGIDESMTIDDHEFVAFAVVGTSVDTIRHQLFKFFAFVDEDGNGSVDFDEINHALDYLGQPTLTDEECDTLLELTKTEGEEIDVSELLNVVSVAKITALTDAFHSGTRHAENTHKVSTQDGEEEIDV
jgi:urea transporter